MPDKPRIHVSKFLDGPAIHAQSKHSVREQHGEHYGLKHSVLSRMPRTVVQCLRSISTG